MPQRWHNGPGIGTDGRFHNSGYNLGYVRPKPEAGMTPNPTGFNALGQPSTMRRVQRQDPAFSSGFGFKGLVVFLLFVGLIVSGIVLIANHERHMASSQRVIVPSLVNLGDTNAFSTLGNAGLSEKLLFTASRTIPFGRVISSTPPAGANVKTGSTVSVYLSCGQPIAGFCS
jgi:hypothetical protein